MTYEVQHNTAAGWANTWSYTGDDGQMIPETFPTIEDAQAALDEFFEELSQEIDHGLREPERRYDRSEFRIHPATETNHQPQP